MVSLLHRRWHVFVFCLLFGFVGLVHVLVGAATKTPFGATKGWKDSRMKLAIS